MKSTSSSIDVSVIIPWRDRVELLERLLRSLARQDYKGSWEIVIADNRSTESVTDVLAQVRDLNIRVVPAVAKSGVSYAANVGAAASFGDKLLFLDADDEVSENYVRDMAESLDTYPFLTSRVDSSTLNAEWTRRAYGEWQADGLDRWLGFLPCTGPNVGIKRDVFQKVGGWPEEYVAAAQDIAFAWRAQLAGVELSFEPRAVYRYRHRDKLGEIYRQQRSWGAAQPLLYRQFRSSGMPRRSIRVAVSHWIRGLVALLRARGRADAAFALTALGQNVGRLRGSFRYRTLYL